MAIRNYYAIPSSDGYSKGFSLCAEEGGELFPVPEADHILFRTEDEAFEFAAELEQPEPDEDQFVEAERQREQEDAQRRQWEAEQWERENPS